MSFCRVGVLLSHPSLREEWGTLGSWETKKLQILRLRAVRFAQNDNFMESYRLG
jgi:hypothetical protein